ncbi:MAG: cell division protein FtsQ/DivIB [Betaproteobacteria bacterium]|nr:cell division protein FtsQ/DivIB [Betaproteobacteria bacterium]
MTDTSFSIESFTRKRGVVIGAALLAMVLAGVGAWVTINAVSREAAQVSSLPQLLPIRSVVFTGELARVDSDELKRIAGGIQTLGGSMLRTDLNQVKAAVRQVEWVRDADVRRRFPGTLEIRIEEHKPFARWLMAGAANRSDDDGEQSFLVNTFGEVFEADTEDKLPLLAGPAGTSLEVMSAWSAYGKQLEPLGQGLGLAELRLSPRRAWQVKLDNGSTLELGRNEAPERLARFVRAYGSVPALQAANARVDLRYASGLALRGVFVKPVVRKAGTTRAATKPARR